jgi:hypothetical protein
MVRGLRNLPILIALLYFAFPAEAAAAGEPAAVPLGLLATSGEVSIGGLLAPTGTTVFSGDRLRSGNAPALISLASGGSIVLAPEAEATLTRTSGELVVRAAKGALAFRLESGLPARLDAGPYRFKPSGTTSGDLRLEAEGRIAVSLSSGLLTGINTVTGKPVAVVPPQTASPAYTGKGSLENDGKTLFDSAQRWRKDALRGQCVVARGEAHRILANNANMLAIAGNWILFTGTYEYTITDCTEQALQKAGAAIGIEEALQVPASTVSSIQLPSTGMSTGTKVAIGAAAAGGAAIAAIAFSRGSKSP